MRKLLMVALFGITALPLSAQNALPRVEAYAAPGLFFEHLNGDPLVPKHQRNASRLGDDVSAGAMVAFGAAHNRLLFKGGLAFRQMHYSMAKYNPGDFFVALFSFDAGPRPKDTFALSYVRFTNSYLEVPLAASVALTRRRYGLPGLAAGVSIRPAFLLSSNPAVKADPYVLPQPGPQQMEAFKKLYKQDAAKTIITVEPYFEASFFVYKRVGMLWQFRPFTFYTSPLNKRFTWQTTGLLGFTFGAVYDFNR